MSSEENSKNDDARRDLIDEEYEQLMEQLHDLIASNRTLNKTLYQNRSHINSIIMLSSLMMVCIISMYVYYSASIVNHIPRASDINLYAGVPVLSQQNEIAKVVSKHDELQTVFYQIFAGRVEQISFDASIIKSDFVIHQKIAGQTGHYLKNIMTKLPLVGAAYSIAEMGAGIAKDMLVLNKMSEETLVFGCFSKKQLFQELATRLLSYDYVLKQIEEIKKTVQLLNIEQPKKEKRAETETAKLANKYGDYLTRVIGTGYGAKLWKACLEHEGNKEKKWDDIDMLALLIINHPKGRSKFRFRKNKLVQEENQRRLEAIKETQRELLVPANVMDIVIEYWTKFGSKQFAQQIVGGTPQTHEDGQQNKEKADAFYFQNDVKKTDETQEANHVIDSETQPVHKRRFSMFHRHQQQSSRQLT